MRAMTEEDAASFESIYGLAVSAGQARDFDRALKLFEQAIALNPFNSASFYKRGNTLKSLGRLPEAVASYDRAIELQRDFAHAYTNRGEVQQTLGLLSDALASYERAISFDPGDAIAHYNRALIMQDRSQWDEVIRSYDASVRADPGFADAQYNRAVALLFTGDFERGWRAYEWRWKHVHRLNFGKLRDFTQPLWLGEASVAGKRLLLHAEGGLGDTLQFCRYAPLLAAKGATVYLEVQKALVGLIVRLEGVSQVIAAGEPLPEFDYHCPLMSLPLAFGTTLDTVPAKKSYLHCDDEKLQHWREVLRDSNTPRVGIAWSGNPDNVIDKRRSIRLADWLPHLPNEFQYFCLQRDIRDRDREALNSNPRIRTFDEKLVDFENTAALCACMDIVLSVDTSLAHLSAAIGQETWILLPFLPDWRWLRHRPDSPWYPTATLYRQTSVGDWSDVFARVGADLRRKFQMSRL